MPWSFMEACTEHAQHCLLPSDAVEVSVRWLSETSLLVSSLLQQVGSLIFS